MKQRVRKAIFPVGGLGTRFLPATKAMPKEMLPVVDKPLIQYAVEEARAAGIEEFIFVTGRGKHAIEDHFDVPYELQQTLAQRDKKNELMQLWESTLGPGSVIYTRQQEPLGLGHAVWCARNVVAGEPVAVLLADDLIKSQTPCLKQMVEAYDEVGGSLVAVMDVPREHTNRYGVLKVGSENGRLVEIKGLVEKPKPAAAPSTLSIIGRYILQPAVFGHLAKGKRGAGNEIQLTDAMAAMIGSAPFHGYRFEGTRYDCGDKAGFVEATLAYGLDHPQIGNQVRDMLHRIAGEAG
jgi:UTP--glucose-1-phosphate uridylyltransferase